MSNLLHVHVHLLHLPPWFVMFCSNKIPGLVKFKFLIITRLAALSPGWDTSLLQGYCLRGKKCNSQTEKATMRKCITQEHKHDDPHQGLYCIQTAQSGTQGTNHLATTFHH